MSIDRMLSPKTSSKALCLDSISPLQLSGGVKTLLLMRFDRKQIFNASTCGDNCAKWILDMAKDRKLVVNLYHVMDFGREDF